MVKAAIAIAAAGALALTVAAVTGADTGTGRQHYAVQVLRLVPGGYIQALGIARVEAKEAVAPRFQKIADGMEPR